MWSKLVFLALAGIAIGQSPWEINREYTYEINSRTLTALPDLKNQYVGIITRGKLILQMQSEGVIAGKLMNMVDGHFHDNMEYDWNLESVENDMNFQESDLNNKLFVMHLEKGIIQSVSMDESFTNDQVNRLKAILSQLQIVADEQYLSRKQYNQMPEMDKYPQGTYTVMEPTITGYCETLYDIEPVPSYSFEKAYANWVSKKPNRLSSKSNEEWFQIVKTMNYSNCYLNRGYHFGFSGDSSFKPNTNQMGNFFTKSTITKVLVKGNWKNFEIQNAYTENRVLVSPTMYQDQQAEVLSQIQLTLSQTRPILQELEHPSQMVNAGDLVYRYNRPSDRDNKIVGATEELHQRYTDVISARVRRSIASQQKTENRIMPSTHRNYYQKPSWYKKLLSTSDSSSSSSSSSSNENEVTIRSDVYYQPKPTMQDAPEIPLYHYTIGNQGHSIQYDDKINLEKETVKLAIEISNDVQNQNEIPKRDTLQKFDILSDLLRTMNSEQIQKVQKQLQASNTRDETISQTLTRKVFYDATAVAGTGPAVNSVLTWISEQEVHGVEAQDLLEDVMRNIRIPTDELMKKIFDFLKDERIAQRKPLYAVGIRAFTDLLRRSHTYKKSAYNHYPIHSFELPVQELEQFVSEEVIPHLASRLHQSVQKKDGQSILLYLRAIGNLGHRDIPRVYEEYLENNDKLTPFQRTALVLSLDKLAKIHPRLARNILFKIYTNIADKPETRSIAALLLVLHADPTTVMLQRMAEMTNNDPSEAVQSMVKSIILSASELTDLKYAKLAQMSRGVRHLLNPRIFGYEYSKTYLRDYVAHEMNLIYRHQLSHIIGNDHVIPKGIIYEAYKNYGGLQTKATEFQAMVSSVEELLKLLPSNDNETHNHKNADNNDQSKWSTHRIAKQLNIQPEMMKELEGHILFKILGRKHYYSFDENSLQDLPKYIASQLKHLNQEDTLRFNKMYSRKHIVLAFPLATGYPYIYTFNMPTLLQAMGNIQMKTTPSIVQNQSWDTIRSLQSLNITAKVHLVFSTDQIAKAGFITPFDRQRYVSGYVRKSFVHVPLNTKIDLDLKNMRVSGKFTPIDSDKNFNMMESSTWPFTLRKDVFDLRPAAEAKDLKLINTNEEYVKNIVLGEKSTGMAFNVHIKHHFPMENNEVISKTLWKQGVASLASFPLSYKNLMGRILNNRKSSAWSFVPYSYQQPYYSNVESNVFMSMASLPYLHELDWNEFVKMHGFLSVINLPFADVDTLQETVSHSSVLKSGNLPWPLRTLDQHMYNIEYDASRSANQIIKFSLTFDQIYNSNKQYFTASRRVQGPSTADEKELSIPMDVTPDSDQRRQQFLENAAHGIKQAVSAVLDFSLIFDGNKKTEYLATISQARSPVDEKSRVLIFLSAKPIKSSPLQQVSVTLTGRYPKKSMLNFEDALKNNDKSDIKAHIYIGENVQKNPTYIKVKGNMEQNENYRNYLLHENSDGKRCKQELAIGKYQTPSCLNAIFWANLQNYITVSAEVENSNQEVKNLVHEFLRYIQQIGFWNLEENKNTKTNPNHFEATLSLAPMMNRVNMSFATGDMNYILRDLVLDKHLVLFLVDENLNNQHQKYKREDRHMCAVDSKIITTFDRNVLNNNIGKCWYAMMQTKVNLQKTMNPGPREVSVLIRNNGNSQQQMDLMVVVAQRNGQDHVIELFAGNSKVQVNGEERKLSSDESVDVYDSNSSEKLSIRVYQQVKGEYVVQLDENLMNIYYDGKRVKIHMNPSYRGSTYGLCGTFTGEKYDDFITPKKCVMRNETFFTASWALADENCSNEVKQIKSEAERMPCNRIQYYSGKFITKEETGTNRQHSSKSDSSSSSSEENNRRKTQKTYPVDCNVKEQIQFIENGDRICFTMDVLPACPSHCTAQRKEERMMSVHCRKSSDSVAQLYKQQILNGANPDISSRPVSKTVAFNIPTKCTYLN